MVWWWRTGWRYGDVRTTARIVGRHAALAARVAAALRLRVRGYLCVAPRCNTAAMPSRIHHHTYLPYYLFYA